MASSKQGSINNNHNLKSNNSMNGKTLSKNSKSSERHISFSTNLNEFKLNAWQEPTTPIDKLNTPRTVTVNTTFFPPSPTPIVESDISISGKENSYFQ